MPGTAGGTSSSKPPAGWYPTPTGEQQYWDGDQWLALPPPPSAEGLGPSNSIGSPEPKKRRNVKWLLIAGGAVLLLAVVGGGIAWKVTNDSQEAEAAAAASASQSQAEAREEQARREAAASSSAAAAQQSRDEAERAARRESVGQIEASVKEMAEGHVTEGIIDGPIIEVTCSPVNGGSTDDLNELTTVFECFVANKDNGDGTLSGYKYNATMNWSSGSYTYGFGAP